MSSEPFVISVRATLTLSSLLKSLLCCYYHPSPRSAVLTSSHPSFQEQSAFINISPVQSAVLSPRLYIERSACPQVPLHTSQLSLSHLYLHFPIVATPMPPSLLLIHLTLYPSLPHNQSPGTLHLSLSSLGPHSLG